MNGDYLGLIKSERQRNLAPSDQTIDWLVSEIERLRRIEDAAHMNAKCLSYGAKKPNMTEVLRANPRPKEA